jgi:hypothetical protein
MVACKIWRKEFPRWINHRHSVFFEVEDDGRTAEFPKVGHTVYLATLLPVRHHVYQRKVTRLGWSCGEDTIRMKRGRQIGESEVLVPVQGLKSRNTDRRRCLYLQKASPGWHLISRDLRDKSRKFLDKHGTLRNLLNTTSQVFKYTSCDCTLCVTV